MRLGKTRTTAWPTSVGSCGLLPLSLHRYHVLSIDMLYHIECRQGKDVVCQIGRKIFELTSARSTLKIFGGPRLSSFSHFLRTHNQPPFLPANVCSRLIGWSVILAYQIEAKVQLMTIAASQEQLVRLCKEYWIAGHPTTRQGTSVTS